MKQNSIKIRGAKVHNLKNINIDIPRDKLVVITGVSGSGKSSLAFDTLYAEGQRKYVESLSSQSRQFLEIIGRPEVEKIEGISPAIAISPRKAFHTPRSTVGTITEIYDYLRLLFSKIGKPYCHKCNKLLSKQSIEDMVEKTSKFKKRLGRLGVIVLGPLTFSEKEDRKNKLLELKRKGFVRARIDGTIFKIEEVLQKRIDFQKISKIEVVVDEIKNDSSIDGKRLADSLRIGLRLGKGVVIISGGNEDVFFNKNYICQECGISLPELEPCFFSFNNPLGACPACTGLGEKAEIDPELLIPNKNLTLEEGAIKPFIRKLGSGEDNFFWRQLKILAEENNFSLSEPVKNFSPETLKILLYGKGKWKGIVSILEKRYCESSSDWLRQEIGKYMILKKCPICRGKRLKSEVLAVRVLKKSIMEIAEMSVDKMKEFFNENFIKARKSKNKKSNLIVDENNVSLPIVKEIINRLEFLDRVGLNYLTLDRNVGTLAGGEEQRINLAMQIGAKLNGVLYVLDEPSMGLHARDQEKLIKTLKNLRDLGNSVIVVEHDPQTIKSADWIIDIGPGAGKEGGKVVFQGKPEKLLSSKTLTGEYLAGKKKIGVEIFNFSSKCSQRDSLKGRYPISNKISKSKLSKNQKYLLIKGARENNLKNIDVKIPLEKFVCVTGVSGSGKSSLVDDILAKALFKKIYRAKDEPGKHKEILGVEFLNKVVLVDQLPIGRTPRSNPATYTGAFSFIRDVFANVKEAKIRGYSPGRFSFNVKGGRCEACEGQGQVKVEMYFLPDVYTECRECQGKRYNKEVLEIEYRGKNIAEVLDMTVKEAKEFFKDIPALFQKLKILDRVGLSYVKLGQPAPSLSGGEAQRVKLATELSKKDTGNTLYILDEPTTGLHFDDINRLIAVLRDLVVKENTVLAVEHNLDFINAADWIIDLGPEGGEKGGYIVAEGTPEEIKKIKKSWTGRYLRKI